MGAAILLDTNIIIDWLRSYRRSRAKTPEQAYYSQESKHLFDWALESQTVLCICPQTIKELLQYPHISEREEKRILELIPAAFVILDTTFAIADIAGRMGRQSHAYRNHHIEDCYIAATAIAHSLPLYTRNPADYQYVPHADLVIKVPYIFDAAATAKDD